MSNFASDIGLSVTYFASWLVFMDFMELHFALSVSTI
jgi:hypothetical protein